MMDDYRDFVPQVHFELVPIKDLVSNQEYQRSLSMIHVKKAAEEFDLHQVNPIKVSRRDGVNYVFNGQHTAEIIALVSGSRDTPVWCMIYDDLDYMEEADIFANQMKNVKPLLPIEIFNANCEAGSDRELIIKGLVESYDLAISNSSTPGNICAVGALGRIYDKYGYNVLDRVLNLIIITWEGEPKSFSGNLMTGLAKLIYTYGDNIKDEVFKEKLGVISIKEIIKTAKERRAGSVGFAEAILSFYNNRLKKGALKWSQLYSVKPPKKDDDPPREETAAPDKDDEKEPLEEKDPA